MCHDILAIVRRCQKKCTTKWLAQNLFVILIGGPTIFLSSKSLAQAEKLQRFHFQEVHMGAVTRITLYTDSQAQGVRAARAAFDEIAAWDRALSDYLNDSEISNLAQIAGTPTAVQARLAKAIKLSLEFMHVSDGAFDPALGRLTKLWRVAFAKSTMPDAAQLVDALKHSGGAHVLWNQESQTVAFDMDGIQFDFGAIGQGLAADAAMNVLRSHHITSALIDVSGDVLASDPPPQTTGWVIKVEPEFIGEQSHTVTLSNQALCVSGDRGQPGHIDGKIFSHILNPKNGRPMNSPRQSMVIANDATTADVIATIACVMDVEHLKLFAKKFPLVKIAIERLPNDGGIQTIEPRAISTAPPNEPTHPQVSTKHTDTVVKDH